MASELIETLRHLLGDTPEAAPIADVPSWWARHQRASEGRSTPVGRAFAGGFAADRLGYAFASGYTEALASLVPVLQGHRAALCATEAAGGHPRAIETTLTRDGDQWRLSGAKSFVTLAEHAEELLVVASLGLDDHERNRLRLVRVPASRQGVELVAVPPPAFVPEVPHAKLVLNAVLVSDAEILAGDGYDDYLKPFRTVEDLHVAAAAIGYLARLAHVHELGAPLLGQLAELAVSVFSLALGDPSDAAVHVALGGAWARLGGLVEGLDVDALDEATQRRMERDRPVFEVAGKARARRLEVAWNRLGHFVG
ncbi:MAG: acyl-CoA dehydrogenase [Sandaracinus sp.]|nr:acyl-CoA dehydrogenase [Sandaracinus sp.]|tara:strand:- start:2403 stop:3335 length:933 start_codon:yes stop_codon:yes gene_type:complete